MLLPPGAERCQVSLLARSTTRGLEINENRAAPVLAECAVEPVWPVWQRRRCGASRSQSNPNSALVFWDTARLQGPQPKKDRKVTASSLPARRTSKGQGLSISVPYVRLFCSFSNPCGMLLLLLSSVFAGSLLGWYIQRDKLFDFPVSSLLCFSAPWSLHLHTQLLLSHRSFVCSITTLSHTCLPTRSPIVLPPPRLRARVHDISPK